MNLKNILLASTTILSLATISGCSKHESLNGTYESSHKRTDNMKLIMIEGKWYQTKRVDTQSLELGKDYIFELTKPLIGDEYISGFKPANKPNHWI